jgi:hypothetical protein
MVHFSLGRLKYNANFLSRILTVLRILGSGYRNVRKRKKTTKKKMTAKPLRMARIKTKNLRSPRRRRKKLRSN